MKVITHKDSKVDFPFTLFWVGHLQMAKCVETLQKKASVQKGTAK